MKRHQTRILFSSVLALMALFCFQNCTPFQMSETARLDIGSKTTGAAPLTLPAPISSLNYAMTFDDEFQSISSISLSNIFDGSKWYNGTEQCCMQDSTGLSAVMFPTSVGGVQNNPYSLAPEGGLNISLDKINNVWYSGVLTSVDANKSGFKQQYGYFEMKAQMPGGVGVWPAFWLLSTDPSMPGEIDIMEYYGHDQGTTFGITLHDWRNGGNNTNITNGQFFPSVSGMTTGIHTYGFLWTSALMIFYFDDAEVWRIATPDVMKQPYYILINNGLGGGWPTTATPDTNLFLIKSVRAYAPQ